MDSFIESVGVSGFWGDRNFQLNVEPDVSIFIGPNGSGKTTLINLIAAGLNADFVTLARLNFQKLQITLVNRRRKNRVQVNIEKLKGRQTSTPRIQYTIQKPNAKSRPKHYVLGDHYYEYWHPRYGAPESLRSSAPDTLLKRLSDLCRTSWLSIHRSAQTGPTDEELSYDSTIDRKLQDISDSFTKYFSSLATRANQETRKFQEQTFLALLYDPDQHRNLRSIEKLDLEHEKNELIKIFDQLGIIRDRSQKLIDAQYEMAAEALKTSRKVSSMGANEFTSLVDTLRVHKIVQEWEKLNIQHEKIFEPRDSFLNIINHLFQKKTVVVNERNQPTIVSRSGKNLSLFTLSSGEKQIFILLGEALLQEKLPCIYIADEPELSLHIDWQAALISNLRKINPNAQIILATHSPDIISEYSDRVVDIADLIE